MKTQFTEDHIDHCLYPGDPSCSAIMVEKRSANHLHLTVCDRCHDGDIDYSVIGVAFPPVPSTVVEEDARADTENVSQFDNVPFWDLDAP